MHAAVHVAGAGLVVFGGRLEGGAVSNELLLLDTGPSSTRTRRRNAPLAPNAAQRDPTERLILARQFHLSVLALTAVGLVCDEPGTVVRSCLRNGIRL